MERTKKTKGFDYIGSFIPGRFAFICDDRLLVAGSFESFVSAREYTCRNLNHRLVDEDSYQGKRVSPSMQSAKSSVALHVESVIRTGATYETTLLAIPAHGHPAGFWVSCAERGRTLIPLDHDVPCGKG